MESIKELLESWEKYEIPVPTLTFNGVDLKVKQFYFFDYLLEADCKNYFLPHSITVEEEFILNSLYQIKIDKDLQFIQEMIIRLIEKDNYGTSKKPLSTSFFGTLVCMRIIQEEKINIEG